MARSASFDWSQTHDDDAIVPRDVRFGISQAACRDWFDGDPVKTAMVDAFSIFLPEGERFFIRSLKHYAARLDDPELTAEINGYAVQEAFHTREHEDYNRALALLGHDVEALEAPMRTLLANVQVPLMRLAATCAIEHLTANFSTVTLRHPDLFEGAHPAYRRLWMWHALEELEHKAVALDVYRKAAAGMPAWKRYGLRVAAMNAIFYHFLRVLLANMRKMMQAQGHATGLRYRLRVMYLFFVSPGYSRLTLGSLLAYFLPGYDPRKVDDTALIRRGRAWLAREFASPAPGTADGPAAPAGAAE